MKVKKLLKLNNLKVKLVNNHKISNLQNNSKDCKLNDVYFVINSLSNKSVDYVEEAIENGATTIIYETSISKSHQDINYIKVVDIKKCLAQLTNIFYRNVTKKVKLIGITGTNGKTTVSNIIYDFLCYEGYASMLVGTNGVFFQDNHYESINTTPDILFTTKIMKHAIRKHLKYVIMEISSIGIRELRVMGYDFDIIVLTNVTHDHLDYHKNIVDYKFSKGLIINSMENKKHKAVILNHDSEYFSFYNQLAKSQVITYGISNPSDYEAINIVKNLNETCFRLLTNQKKYMIKSSLVGGFNVYNILAAIATLSKLNFSVKKCIDFLKIYVNVSGRMDIVKYNDRTIVIDFAHTPDGVKNALKELKEYPNRKLTVIIGCGGCRDKSKRPLIGEIACNYADRIIFTNDNPRDEVPEEIINDMTQNLAHQNFEVILNRHDAIYKALDSSIKDEIIAVLGKGSETNQIIMGIKYPFNDKDTVKTYIKERSNE